MCEMCEMRMERLGLEADHAIEMSKMLQRVDHLLQELLKSDEKVEKYRNKWLDEKKKMYDDKHITKDIAESLIKEKYKTIRSE